MPKLQEELDRIEKSLSNSSFIPKIFEPLADAHLAEKQEFRKATKIKDCWYASDLGGCPSGSYYSRLSPESSVLDARTLRVFAVGNLFHGFFENLAEEAGILVAKEDELHVVDPIHNARGRADMLVRVGKYHILYDIKTMHSKGFWYLAEGNFQAKHHHKLQLHFYMNLLKDKYPNLMGGMVYVSKDDLSFQEIPVQYDPALVDEINNELDILNTAWETKVPPPPAPAVVYNEGTKGWEINWQAKYCSYHHVCTGNPDWMLDAKKEVFQKNRMLVDLKSK